MQKISVFLVNLLLLSGVSDAEEIEENLTLLVGDTAILNSGFPKISSSDTVQWMFGKERIAEIRNGQKLKSVVPPENLIKRLQLNETTGSLNITNVNINHSGTYMLEIRSRNTITKTFTVIVTERNSGVSPGAAAGIIVGLLVFHWCLQL